MSNIINWSGLSEFITSNKELIREGRIPNKHKEQIEELLYYVECWKKGKKLINSDDLRDKIKDFDLISVILEKK